ncbi:hypothetical protein CRENBAI_000663 [Crenichthys baileyi]|uniref:Ig-like domain-containing protein n=1 Tax=Crenichthys baileyi TaxID=28760 RepID=A0AAV9R207_9TELE
MSNNCLRINWLFSESAATSATDLVKLGQINQTQASKARGDRLSVSAKCSLIIQRVTAADVGTYFCQQLNNLGQKEITTTAVLSILNITEQRDGEEVTLKCSVISNDPCKHSIKWLLNGQNIDKNNKNLKTEQSNCFAKVTFQISHYAYKPGSYDLLKCEVAETGARGKQFIFRSQTPGRANGKSENNEAKQASGVWWLYVIVAVGLAAFLLAVGLLIKRNKNKGNKTQVDENLDEPDETNLYATIFLAKTTSNKVWRTDTTVIYSAIKAEASLDLIDHCASVK